MGELIAWGFAVTVASMVATAIGFFFLASIKRVLEAEVDLLWWLRLLANALLVVGGIADLVLAATAGSWAFREWPWSAWRRGEFTFSQRVQHWANETPDTAKNRRNRRLARERWAPILNAADPRHIKLW